MPKRTEPTARRGANWRRWCAALSMPVIALMLTGCGSSAPLLPERAPVPANLTSPCPDQRPPESATGEALVTSLTELAIAYRACQRKHRRLVEAVTGP